MKYRVYRLDMVWNFGSFDENEREFLCDVETAGAGIIPALQKAEWRALNGGYYPVLGGPETAYEVTDLYETGEWLEVSRALDGQPIIGLEKIEEVA